MLSVRRFVGAAALICGVLIPSVDVLAQGAVTEIVHAFEYPPSKPKGTLLQASNGVIYGATSFGGRYGVGMIFALQRDDMGQYTVSPVHHFSQAEGAEPRSALVEGPEGALYGVTRAGGAGYQGSIFRVTPSGDFTVLHTFFGPDGAQPAGALVLGSNGNFYGTTYEGGVSNKGTVFRITPSGELTTIYSFNGTSAQTPNAPLVQAADGHLYGTTQGLPVVDDIATSGSVFKISHDGDFTILHEFERGEFAVTALTPGPDGYFYGISRELFAAESTRIFKISPSGEHTVLHQTVDATEGTSTDSFVSRDKFTSRLFLAPDGQFYGTLPGNGPHGRGTAFRITAAGVFTVIHAFTASEGASYSGVIQASDGIFYGVTASGGYGDNGGVFAMDPSGSVTMIHLFNVSDGAQSLSAPIVGSDGGLYLTTAAGGLFERGTIWRRAAAGTVSVLHSFSGPDGAQPTSSLVQAADGFFYGTTLAGGCGNRGTVFKIDASGDFTLLHCFTAGEGHSPAGPLIQAGDGNFYGTTLRGGSDDRGTVFRVSPSGTFATVRSFGPADPLSPVGALAEGSDGNLYGTTSGLDNSPVGGSVFRITRAGALNVLHTFVDRIEPISPTRGAFFPGGRILSGLTRISDGSFIGVTCCETPQGRVFRVTMSGAVTRMLAVRDREILFPPIQATDGNFYGLALGGPVIGPSSFPTMYKLTPAGGFSDLTTLPDEFGLYGIGGLVQGPDGALYGTTTRFGPYGRGVLFRVALP